MNEVVINCTTGEVVEQEMSPEDEAVHLQSQKEAQAVQALIDDAQATADAELAGALQASSDPLALAIAKRLGLTEAKK